MLWQQQVARNFGKRQRAMSNDHTTAAVQRYLDQLVDLSGDAPVEPVIRALVGRSVDRLHCMCAG